MTEENVCEGLMRRCGLVTEKMFVKVLMRVILVRGVLMRGVDEGSGKRCL